MANDAVDTRTSDAKHVHRHNIEGDFGRLLCACGHVAGVIEKPVALPSNPSNLALQKGADVLWERQFKGTPWEGKVGLINPDSMEEYRALALAVWRAVQAHTPETRRAGVSFEEHERYKRCLYRANGRLIQAGHEPEKLNYADQAAADVLAERRRQVTAEGWAPEHDDAHSNFELSAAAASYALRAPLPHDQGDLGVPMQWPWSQEWWKPTNPRRDLVKAGALILAEIERLDRANAQKALACVCGDPRIQGVTHRTEGPCFVTPSNGGPARDR